MSATNQTSEPVEIGGEYWDAQLRAFDALESGDYDVVVFRAGYGGGKTLFGSDYVLGEAMQTPNGHSLILAPDKTKGGPATYKGFYERLPGENTVPNDADGDPENSPIVAGHHGTKHRVTLINGHIIQLGGADIWSRFAGTEFNVIWCDEVAHYGTTDLYDLHEMLVTRQRTEQGPNVTLWTSTGNGFNQFYDITERQIQPDGAGGEEPLPWRDRMKVVVGDTRDNPFHNELEKMKAQFEGTEREKQALEGGFSAAEGLVYGQFSREVHVPEVDVDGLIPEDATPIYGYDAGWDHPRVLVQWYPTHHDQWIATDCYYASEMAFDDLCDPEDRSGYVYDNDLERGPLYAEHEPEHIQKFNQAGFNAQKASKSLDEGIPFVRGLLEVKGDPERPGLLVSDDCVELVQEFQSYKEEHVGSSGDVPDHVLDASRYALFTHDSEPETTVHYKSGSMPSQNSIR
ncbi:terminase large subunit domain-containing protein [Halostagnicola kamekurae]|uniref:Terminase-like family protein n=1 Tax=Halostagnicola kamekurae TaxID=619731 RepID=A0A1I6RDP8_9EURY|nr:terminase family protein [Halostagnicola kamekurae]SFS62849.1 Terminase-like family protein [Halostagnicola kamekurae]